MVLSVQRRKGIRAAGVLCGSGLAVAAILWFLTRDFSLSIGIGFSLVVFGLVVLVAGFLPPGLRLENKPRWLQILTSSVGLVLIYLTFISSPVPSLWLRYFQIAFLPLTILALLWPNQKRDIPDASLSH